MTDTPENGQNVAELLQSLRRKEGKWVEWAHACQTLQKAGYSPQAIFEETGFEPIQQNQIVVASQVYDTLLAVGVSDAVKEFFGQRSSDILYELRILTQRDRASAAELVFAHKLDADEVHEVARALKDFSRFGTPPDEFTTHPGDGVAYQAWKAAKQKTDLQERSRLIARGLKFAHSATARQAVEKLLTDFTVTPSRPAPRLPLYRLESDEELPRIVPVVGKLPLTKADLDAVPMVEEVGAFHLVQFSGIGAWVTLPGWQVVRTADDPIALLCDSDKLPNPPSGVAEEVVVVIDRAQRDWQADSYFLMAEDDQLRLRWFEEAPEVALLGRVVLVMRPKKVLDEDYTKELWQIDE
ncbi:RuBisCO accumulation factor 1 [Myxacorys almedinensis]|uniref:RuBisCO accumulation factor 1 n=1 Tax=Myxacorys almedinensis A TaxID=2690445 RepID=A0A8J7Z0M7_9CYAN|nr:RuBisCO accumulation factor 1 [Myxacorys almedinensis]NDJ16006.1 hypothetical protein [Myxacorys almedinensis A]